MLTTVEGFFDGESVKLSEPVADKKNQRVIVTFVDDSAQVSKPKKKLTAEDRQRIREALANGECVSKDTTDFDVDAYIRESRGYTHFGLDAVINMRLKRPDSDTNKQTEELMTRAGA